MHAAIFLDRDGVIIANRPDYVRDWSEVVFLPQVLEALAKLYDSPYKIVIITNQAGVGRGIFSKQIADEINCRLVEVIIEAGGRIDGVYMCPHRPDENCDCRKPRPGMLFQAARDFDIDLQNSILIGDNLSDLQAALAAGLKTIILVKTGLGEFSLGAIETIGIDHVLVYDSLGEAIENLGTLDEQTSITCQPR
jgi:D-glycero-D-manno-heptose 1,7-bisphosphate phosphatase